MLERARDGEIRPGDAARARRTHLEIDLYRLLYAQPNLSLHSHYADRPCGQARRVAGMDKLRELVGCPPCFKNGAAYIARVMRAGRIRAGRRNYVVKKKLRP